MLAVLQSVEIFSSSKKLKSSMLLLGVFPSSSQIAQLACNPYFLLINSKVFLSQLSYHQPRGMLSYYNLDEPFVKIYTYTKGLLLLIIVSNQIFLNKTKERR